VLSDRSSVDTLRAGVNHSANWRVSGGFRIFTASNLSTGVTIQSGATASNWCSGQTNAVISTSTCAYLGTDGAWHDNSDVRRKHNILAVSGEDVLARLRTLSVNSWSYRIDTDGVRHLGPMAQDFHAAFGLGRDSVTIATLDEAGVALASIKALDQRSQSQQAELTALRSEVAELRRSNADKAAQLEALNARLARIEASLNPATAAPR
jgi:hypothetical protein